MLFPSIFWKSAYDACSILGAIPSPLLSESAENFGLASTSDHVRSRITNASVTYNSSSYYVSYCYDKLTNLAANHQDTRVIIRRGLTVDANKNGELGLRGTGDSSMLELFDSKSMVRNLCASQQHHTMTHFLTFTCNAKKHFGTKPIKLCIDSGEWKNSIRSFDDLSQSDQDEFKDSVNQAASGLLVRTWQEVSQLFLNYLMKSPTSPYVNVKSMFTRQEHQSLVGNLHHLHLILELDLTNLTSEQNAFVNDLARCSMFELVRIEEVEALINDGTFKNTEDCYDVQNDASKFLPHMHNLRCLVKNPDGTFRCRKLNYLEISKDNTKHTFQEFDNDVSNECLCRLIQIGMVDLLK